MQRTIAIIGTAGRDKQFPIDLSHWEYMCRVAGFFLRSGDHLVSGGAAWADHVAVWAFTNGLSADLTLHLPAPFEGSFMGAAGTSGAAANHYHRQFSRAVGRDTLKEIQAALQGGTQFSVQPESKGYAAMFARNKLVAEQCTHVLAFTFGTGDEPADGGTKATWDMAGPHKKRRHVSLLGAFQKV
ncbi:hypothetical protein R3Q56_006701 [Pseudomonas aeruginosa]|nr:hypothetical protein [Pseudomonas aeruginosa]ELR2942330.1 hypothetical protein [Pseudomonas aeruginosa]